MSIVSFKEKIQALNIRRKPIEILQINIGKLCNQACHHCHVEAGPKRTENMQAATVDRVIELLKATPTIHTLDITGGAPELNVNFKRLVLAAKELNKKIIDRCNLTVFYEPGQEETAYFLQQNEVHVIASLPCYSKDNVEKQRGRGVFDKSILALQLLNKLGYAQKSSALKLDLVYNPLGAFLPPDQAKLELKYKAELKELFNIDFNQLYTITNMPIKRFLDDLRRSNQLEAYMQLLANSYNPKAALGIMCRNLVSVSWDGKLYDCDFNQMLEMPTGAGFKTIYDIASFNDFDNQEIAYANHCYACTAGAGSSCGGSIV